MILLAGLLGLVIASVGLTNTAIAETGPSRRDSASADKSPDPRDLMADAFVVQVEQGLGALEGDAQRQLAQNVSSALEELIRSGEATVTEEGSGAFAARLIEIAQKTPLMRDNIESLQFSIKKNRAFILFGGRNSIAYREPGKDRIRVTFNGSGYYLSPGDIIQFQRDEQKCQLLYNGSSDDQETVDFTVLCP